MIWPPCIHRQGIKQQVDTHRHAMHQTAERLVAGFSPSLDATRCLLRHVHHNLPELQPNYRRHPNASGATSGAIQWHSRLWHPPHAVSKHLKRNRVPSSNQFTSDPADWFEALCATPLLTFATPPGPHAASFCTTPSALQRVAGTPSRPPGQSQSASRRCMGCRSSLSGPPDQPPGTDSAGPPL
jgi:hypothetical protein